MTAPRPTRHKNKQDCTDLCITNPNQEALCMARPAKRYRIRVRGSQREDIDADLLMQALLQMAEEREQTEDRPDGSRPGDGTGAPAGASS